MFMSNFWTTIGMDEQPGNYFFSHFHLVYLLLNIVLFFILFIFLKNKSKKTQDRYINFFLIFILFLKFAGEALFIYEYNTIGNANSSYAHPFWDVNTFFSFQLCGMMNILLPIVIWFDIKPLKDYVFATSVLGGLAVIFYPVTVLYGQPFQVILPNVRSSIVHLFLIFIPLFLIYRGDFKFKKERWHLIAFGLVLSALWATIGNLLIDTTANNMYLMSNPFKNGPIPVINVLPNGYHIIFLTAAVTFGYIVVYQIAALFDGRYYHKKILSKKRS